MKSLDMTARRVLDSLAGIKMSPNVQTRPVKNV
jgi:hypothetical protein